MADRLRAAVPLAAACAALLAAAACTGGSAASSGPAGGAPATAEAPPPAPPAACLLDVRALEGDTGVAWTADASTASDERCVYDPRGAARADFLAVDVGPAVPLDVVAQACDAGSRAPAAGGRGFVCRLSGGSVLAALERGDRLVSVAASAVPAGTTAARLVVALDRQLAALAGR